MSPESVAAITEARLLVAHVCNRFPADGRFASFDELAGWCVDHLSSALSDGVSSTAEVSVPGTEFALVVEASHGELDALAITAARELGELLTAVLTRLDDGLSVENFFAQSNAVLYAKDLNGRYRIANELLRSAANLEHDPIGRRDDELFPTAIAKEFRDHDLEVTSSGEAAVYHEPGRTGKTYVSAKFPIRDRHGEVVGSGGITVDGTDLIDASRLLGERERELEALLSNTHLGICTVGLDGVITWTNDRLAELLGYTTSELVGVHVDQLADPSDPTSQVIATNFITDSVAGRGDSRVFFKWLQRGNGGRVPTEVNSRLVRTVDGEPMHFVSYLSDVSDRVHLEDRLRQSEKMEAIGQMVGGIAHDINNQLGGILGFAELLHAELTSDSARERSAVIIDTATRASEFTRQLMSFARQVPSGSEPVDIHELILSSAALIERSMDPAIEVTTDLAAEHATVLGEEGPLQSTFLNLAVNARDAMPDGGSYHVRTSNVTAGDREMIRIVVSDTGTGMDDRTRRRAFEPFFTTKPRGHGSGIGLASVYAAIRNHGGTIAVSSELGSGTTFEIALPVQLAPVERAKQATDQEGGGRPVERAVVVDDDEIIREVVATSLRSNGCEVEAFASARSALEYFAEFGDDVDLVVLDVMMPEMSGRELLDQLVAIRDDVKALVITGVDSAAAAEFGEMPQPPPVLQKPFRINELHEAIANLA